MSWGTRRRNTIIFLVALFFVIPIIVSSFLVFYEESTCFDNKHNGDESGVDCGGSCQLLCTDQTISPLIVWERFFEVDRGVYNVIAYVENQNPEAGIQNATYSFKLFNREGVLIAERKGSVKLRPKSITPIIENNLITSEQVPNRVEFAFDNNLVYQKEDPLPVFVILKNQNYFIDNQTNTPKVTAEVQNITLETVDNLKIIVLLYDVFDNVVATSSTLVEKIYSEDTKNITFTWPVLFDRDVTRIELVPIYESSI